MGFPFHQIGAPRGRLQLFLQQHQDNLEKEQCAQITMLCRQKLMGYAESFEDFLSNRGEPDFIFCDKKSRST